MKIVLLNGPPRSGKDTAGAALTQIGAECVKLADAVKCGTHALFGLDGPSDAFERTKDVPCDEFLGLSPRQAYILTSERMVKPALGIEHFGRVLARRLEAHPKSQQALFAVTDSGFADEARPLIQQAGAENVLLVRLHREGCTYAGDSRSYLKLDGIQTRDIRNNGSQDDFEMDVCWTVAEWTMGR